MYVVAPQSIQSTGARARTLVAGHVQYQALTTHNPIQSYYLFICAEGKAATADDDDVDLFGDDDDVSWFVGRV